MANMRERRVILSTMVPSKNRLVMPRQHIVDKVWASTKPLLMSLSMSLPCSYIFLVSEDLLEWRARHGHDGPLEQS